MYRSEVICGAPLHHGLDEAGNLLSEIVCSDPEEDSESGEEDEEGEEEEGEPEAEPPERVGARFEDEEHLILMVDRFFNESLQILEDQEMNFLDVDSF